MFCALTPGCSQHGGGELTLLRLDVTESEPARVATQHRGAHVVHRVVVLVTVLQHRQPATQNKTVFLSPIEDKPQNRCLTCVKKYSVEKRTATKANQLAWGCVLCPSVCVAILGRHVPHGAQSDSVGEIGIVRQERREEKARERVHRDALGVDAESEPTAWSACNRNTCCERVQSCPIASDPTNYRCPLWASLTLTKSSLQHWFADDILLVRLFPTYVRGRTFEQQHGLFPEDGDERCVELHVLQAADEALLLLTRLLLRVHARRHQPLLPQTCKRGIESE